MKKFLGLFFLISLIFPTVVRAVDTASVCNGVVPIVINDSMKRPPNKFQTVINQYQTHSCLNGIAYCLCFQYQIPFDTSLMDLSLDSTASNKPIYISGLAGAMVLKGSQPITLLNSTFTNCKDCLSIQQNNAQLDNVSVTCTGKDKGGVGINLAGNNASVVGGAIQNCEIGLQVNGNNNHIGPDIFQAGKQVTAYDNGIAFKVFNGQGNYFKHNSVYENDDSRDGNFENIEGIFLNLDANGGLKPPVLLSKSNVAVANQPESVLTYPSSVTKLPEDGSSVDATFQIISPYPNVDLEVSFTGDKTDQSLRNVISNQGKEFYKDAVLKSSEIVDNHNYKLTYEIPMNRNAANKKAVALLHYRDALKNIDYGSSTYSAIVILNPPIGVLSTADIISSSDLTSGGGSTLNALPPSGGDAASAPPASTASSTVDDKKKSGDSIGGSNALGDGTVSVSGGGITGTGATGGVQSSGGCSLDPEGDFDLNFVLILFGAVALPLGSLFLLRLFYPAKKCQVHSIAEGRRKRL